MIPYCSLPRVWTKQYKNEGREGRKKFFSSIFFHILLINTNQQDYHCAFIDVFCIPPNTLFFSEYPRTTTMDIFSIFREYIILIDEFGKEAS